MAASFISAYQDVPDTLYVEPVKARSVATNQIRKASGQCAGNGIEISWMVWNHGSGTVLVDIGEKSINLSETQPIVARFFSEGGVQRIFITCQADDDFEITLFRALYTSEGIDNSRITFSIKSDLTVTYAGEPQKIESDELEVWYRDWGSPDIAN